MRVLITGATGVVGIRAIPLLVARGHEVTAAVRHEDRLSRVAALGARGVVLDLFDREAVLRAVGHHDAVVNLATHMPASVARMALPWSWRENDRLRRDASRLLAGSAREAGVPRFIQESFAPAYPDCGDAWIDETTPIAPVRYNRSIADAERSAEWFASRGEAGVVLRFAAFYGHDHLLASMLAAVRRGWSPLPGREGAWFSSVSWDDAAAAVVAALALPSGAWNVCDDQPLTRRQYVNALAASIGAPPPRFPPAWTRHLMGSAGALMARSQRMSNRKLRAASDWRPTWKSAVEGLPVAGGSGGR